MGQSAGVSSGQRGTLDRLSRLPELAGYYLAGGTAIAAHLGHRRSLDLDLFSTAANVDLEVARRAIAGGLAGTAVLDASEVSVKLLIAGAPVDLVAYPYPPLEKPRPGPGGFAMAGLLDLATMKLAAVARRGIRRDFWDLHAIATSGISLRRASLAYVRRFDVAESDLYAVFRSLTHFVDAESEAVWPKGLTPSRWRTIRAFFETEAPRLLGLRVPALRARRR